MSDRQPTGNARRAPLDLGELFRRLSQAYGPQGWWPAETAEEMIVGAILVQNTAWRNVEKALASLKAADRLSLRAIDQTPLDELAALIRSSGFYREKAKKLKAFAAHVHTRYAGNLAALLAGEPRELRRELLALRGIGPETADSIILYAAGQPIFVVDAYTRRLFARLGLPVASEYDAIQRYCHERLATDARLFNEYHALIVRHAVVHCRARPRCAGCPLAEVCPSFAPGSAHD